MSLNFDINLYKNIEEKNDLERIEEIVNLLKKNEESRKEKAELCQKLLKSAQAADKSEKKNAANKFRLCKQEYQDIIAVEKRLVEERNGLVSQKKSKDSYFVLFSNLLPTLSTEEKKIVESMHKLAIDNNISFNILSKII